MNEIFFQTLTNSGIIFTGIIVLTFLQQIHFFILGIIERSSFVFGVFGKILFRIGVIVHEFSHLIFAILSGAKITKIDLFSRTGGSVTYQTKDYIGSIGSNANNSMFWIFLVFNQIGTFLTSIGPLFIGILLNYFFVKNFLGIKGDIFDINEFIKVFSNDYFKLFIFTIYTVFFIPSFILSWQDISNFIIYKQENIGATIVGSIFNILIFIGFLAILSNFLGIFISFFIFYLISFLFLLVFFIIFMIMERFFDIP